MLKKHLFSLALKGHFNDIFQIALLIWKKVQKPATTGHKRLQFSMVKQNKKPNNSGVKNSNLNTRQWPLNLSKNCNDGLAQGIMV